MVRRFQRHDATRLLGIVVVDLKVRSVAAGICAIERHARFLIRVGVRICVIELHTRLRLRGILIHIRGRHRWPAGFRLRGFRRHTLRLHTRTRRRRDRRDQNPRKEDALHAAVHHILSHGFISFRF